MARLGHSQKPVIMPNYPHFMAGDSGVWTRYLKSPVAPISEVWYDVHVGKGIAPVDPADEMGAKIGAGLGKKRIDVVAKVRGGFWVIELKPFANMSALGQIIAYTKMFIDEFEVDGQVVPVIIADMFDQDVIEIMISMGITAIET